MKYKLLSTVEYPLSGEFLVPGNVYEREDDGTLVFCGHDSSPQRLLRLDNGTITVAFPADRFRQIKGIFQEIDNDGTQK